MKEKTLYEFSLKDDKGKERKFRILKPNRRQIEDAEMEYAVEMSKCIKRGILTKTMLAKKYSDSGGLMSEQQAKRLMSLYHDIAEKTNEHGRLSSLQKKTKKVKEQISKLEEEIAEIKREIVDIETSNVSLFNQTAESKAQNATVKWYTINLTQQEVDGEWENVYEGEEYEDRLESFYEKEDNEDEEDIYFEAMGKVVSVLALWFFNQGSNQQEFDELLAEFVAEEEEEEAQEESEASGEDENDSSDESEG